MIHRRRAIRQALVQALVSANTAAGTRVFDHPWDERTVFPAIVVEDLGEQQDSTTIGAGAARPVERSYVLEVTAELQPTADWASVRDDLMADIEATVAAAIAGISGIKDIVPVGYSADSSSQGSKPTVVGRQRFQVTYLTPMNNPSAAL